MPFFCVLKRRGLNQRDSHIRLSFYLSWLRFVPMSHLNPIKRTRYYIQRFGLTMLHIFPFNLIEKLRLLWNAPWGNLQQEQDPYQNRIAKKHRLVDKVSFTGKVRSLWNILVIIRSAWLVIHSFGASSFLMDYYEKLVWNLNRTLQFKLHRLRRLRGRRRL